MIKLVDQINNDNSWRKSAIQLLDLKNIDEAAKSRFHTIWIEKGHRIREQISNDLLLVSILIKLLPRYTGKRKALFRGENRERLDSNRIGFCWTESIDTARIFARGLNAINSGGILLSYTAEPECIIAGIADHSKYLGENEYTLNPFKIHNLIILEEYPTSFSSQIT